MANKVAIITGAGKGIGKALAIGMSRQDFSVVATARSLEELKETSKRLEGEHCLRSRSPSRLWEGLAQAGCLLCKILADNGL